MKQYFNIIVIIFIIKEDEGGIRFNDRALNIDWKLNHDSLIINERDRNFPTLEQLQFKLKN